DRVGVPHQCERELFFVTPKASIKEVTTFRKSLMKLLVLLFNLKPSAGLAFAVACGLSESYGAAARALLHTEGADRSKIGNFLGQDFSLCLLVRFGVLDSLPLLCTGVISCLEMAFARIQLPEDMDRMERLLHAAALVWWRKHRALSPSMLPPETTPESEPPGSNRELVGHALLQYISSAQVLAQLMFSTVMLHCVIHGDGTGEPGEMSYESWTGMNKGLEDINKDVPEFVQRPIYDAVCKKFSPELSVVMTVGYSPTPSRTGLMQSRLGSDSSEDELLPYGQDRRTPASPSDADTDGADGNAPSAFQQIAQAEGWVQLNCHLPIIGSAQVRPGSETLGSDHQGGTDPPAAGEPAMEALRKAAASAGPGMSPGPPESGWVWASLCSICLLFSSLPPGRALQGTSDLAAPHAVVDVRLLHVIDVDRETCSLTVGTFSANPYRPKAEGNHDDGRAIGDIPVVLQLGH
ncbi:BIG4, partial [Symbiodinium pilosum]